MVVVKKCLFTTFILIAVITVFFSGETVQSQTGNKDKVEQAGTKEEEKKHPIDSLENATIPIKTEKLDEMGEALGKSVDKMEYDVSDHLGKWIRTTPFYGISWLKLIICFGLLLLVFVAEVIVSWIIRLSIGEMADDPEKATWLDLILTALKSPLALFIWVYGIYWAVSPLFVHFRPEEGVNVVKLVLQKTADIGGSFAVVWFIYRLVSVVDMKIKLWSEKTGSNLDDVLAPIVGKTLRVFIVIVGGMIIIQHLTGVRFGPLLASLGLGGLAIALAAQDTISNFFGTLTILFDKPFQVGERIKIGDMDGFVEVVGIRSCRVRTLEGHVVTIPNKNIVNTPLENISLRPNLRWMTNIGIRYDTPAEKIEKAVSIIEQILENHEGMHVDYLPRVFFNGFNDSGLNIFIIAWYHPPDWWNFQEWVQKTCLQITRRFREEGIEFAFPARTVYLANDASRSLKLKMDEEKDKPAI